MQIQTSENWKFTFRENLLTWFAKNSRDLPWRQTTNPYFIWVSEIMLQQTQVSKVIDYYNRFIQEFPSITYLAQAKLVHVLKVWEGMGYYARARNMHKAANELVQTCNGIFPTQYKDIIKLKGIGLYTAAAIASIAFNQNHAVVDGNVIRALARIFCVNVLPKSAQGKTLFEKTAAELLDETRPGDYNQALMELGALVCTPARPKCPECPINSLCGAYSQQKQHEFPVKSPRRSRPHYMIAAGIIYHQDLILIAQRPENGLLGGLWEFPGGKQKENETLEETAAREIQEELDIQVQVRELFAVVKHQYTHFTITLHVFKCDYLSGQPKAIGCSQWRWVTMDEIDAFPFPKANRKILDQLTGKTL